MGNDAVAFQGSPRSSGASGGGARVGGDRSLVMVELLSDQAFSSIGSGSWSGIIAGPVIRGLGPQILDIAIHGFGRGWSAGFKYKVVADKSYDGDQWYPFSGDLLGPTTSAAYIISATPHAVRGDFGLYIRFRVEVSDGGGGVKEVGFLSVTAAIRLHT